MNTSIAQSSIVQGPCTAPGDAIHIFCAVYNLGNCSQQHCMMASTCQSQDSDPALPTPNALSVQLACPQEHRTGQLSVTDEWMEWTILLLSLPWFTITSIKKKKKKREEPPASLINMVSALSRCSQVKTLQHRVVWGKPGDSVSSGRGIRKAWWRSSLGTAFRARARDREKRRWWNLSCWSGRQGKHSARQRQGGRKERPRLVGHEWGWLSTDPTPGRWGLRSEWMQSGCGGAQRCDLRSKGPKEVFGEMSRLPEQPGWGYKKAWSRKTVK